MMKTIVLAALGTVFGLVLGSALGILAGIAWVSIFSTTDFEGYSAMLVFFTFAPVGAVVGGLTGAIWAAYTASRARIRMEGDA
jgi:Na+/glutamate symporter